MTENPQNAERKRFLALDVFRGITIGGMILVNNKGGPNSYPSLSHVGWDGWNLADLVFPFFVFIMGVAMAFSMSNRVQAGHGKVRLYWHTLYRTAVLFALGLLSYYNFDQGLEGFKTLRIMGVLQRLALVYFFASIISMNAGAAFGASG